MPQIDRFSVSLDTELLAAFDRHIASKGYDNRSEAIRDMIRDLLTAGRLQKGGETVLGFLTAVCDHRVGEAANRLRACLTDHADLVFGSLHLACDEHREGVVISLKGPAERVRATADQLQALRGIAHGHLALVPINE